jgi:pyruvate ferredoxin oxidoreductase alpha subunit/phenylglyoxylate dehydrogenase alpha subunit
MVQTKSPLGQVGVYSGNHAAAIGVLLCQPDVISAYPITPQTSTLEYLARYHADGLLKAEMVEVEGELSALSVLIGAASAGGRTFNSTASQGLFFMFEAYVRVPVFRLPIVMVLVTRETDPGMVAASHQDAMVVKETGWIQLHVENCQEILDGLIMSYRLAEDPDISLPVTLCYDGYYLSYLTERVDIPSQEEVDAFLPKLDRGIFRLDPQAPMWFPTYIPTAQPFTEYRYRHMAALERAKSKLDEIDQEFGERFGRSYGGQIEEYRTEDADIVLLTMGDFTGTARVVVDQKREEGVKVGLIKVRLFRPFTKEKLTQAMRGKKAIGIVDRNVCFGWDSGTLSMETKAALGDAEMAIPVASFIGGLHGADLVIPQLHKAIDITNQAAQGQTFQKITWLDLEE